MEKPRSQLAQTEPFLRSGLYLLHGTQTPLPENGHRVYVIFWPEDTTWSNNTTSSAKKNRVAFMRYLTKLTDQVFVFVSPEHAGSIVWKDSAVEAKDVAMFEDDDANGDDDDMHDDLFSSGRFFSFSVEKTDEQEEDVKMKPGFKASISWCQCRDVADWRSDSPSKHRYAHADE